MDNSNGQSKEQEKNTLLERLAELRSLPVGDIFFAARERGLAGADTQPWARFTAIMDGCCDLEVYRDKKPCILRLRPGDVMVMPELAYCRNTFLESCRIFGAVRRNNYLRLIYHDFDPARKNNYPPDIQYHIEDTLHLSTIHALSAFVALENSGVTADVMKDFFRLMLDLIGNDLRRSERKHFDKSYFIWMNVVEYIERNYDKPLTRRQIGGELKVSESYLSKLFRRYAGASVNEFQTRIRMAKAVELLKDPALTVAETAYNCGYQSTSFFIRKFHEFYSATPAQYRLRFK